MFKSVFPPQRALVTITFEGEAIQVEEGTTVAAAVLDRAGGETRTTADHDQALAVAQGLYGAAPILFGGFTQTFGQGLAGLQQQQVLVPVADQLRAGA